jgi:O-antigen/teichoic acid export membrane protein
MAIFLAIDFLFGREILGFFRPKSVNEGLTALHLMAVATAISILFSLAPTCQKFMRRNSTLLRIVVGAAAIQVILLVLLVPYFAATGAAFAYAVSMCGMYLVSSRMAHRNFVKLRSGDEA